MPCRKSQWILRGFRELGVAHCPSQWLPEAFPAQLLMLCRLFHLCSPGRWVPNQGQADLPCHTWPVTSCYPHMQTCTINLHIRSPAHTFALSPHVAPCTCMCPVILIVAAPPGMCTPSPSLLPQGHRPVVRGQRRLGDEATALAAQEPTPLQRTLRPTQGLMPEGPGAPQPGGALLPRHRVSETLQDAQGGLHWGSRGDGRLHPGVRPAVLTASLLPRLWIRWPEAGRSATRTRWTGPTPLTHH